MLSRVVPAMSVTMLRCSSISELTSDDLPALGRPTMAKRGSSSSMVSSAFSGICLTTSSRRSPVPLPLTAEMEKGLPRPRA